MDALPPLVNNMFSRGEMVHHQNGDILGEQYAKCNYLYMVLEGSVGLYYEITSLEQEIKIGKASFKYAPVGLNVFSHPFRNESTYKVTSDRATLIRWTRQEILELIANEQDSAMAFLQFLNSHAHELIKDSSELFAGTPIISKTNHVLDRPSEGYQSMHVQDQLETVIFLLQSPFMEVLDENELVELTKSIIRKQYKLGDILDLQDNPADGINILESGEVQFSRENSYNGDSYNIIFRSISTPGYVLGSSGALNKNSIITSRINRDSVLLHIPYEALEKLSKKQASFGLKYQKRILWLIKNQLRAIRARLIAAQFNEEHMVITGLIESNKSKLNIESKLHQVPHLMADKLTMNQGFEILHDVELKGIGPEKNIASLCLDNLHQTQKESQFYNGLKEIYRSVADAPEDYDPSQIRYECIKSTSKAFKPASVMIKGFANLPEKPGNIFIYNHLLNDPYYTLANQFQITLDSHFISSLLFEKYGDVGQRIVRVGRNIEYGHQEYYERLSFIDVYTKESEKLEETEDEKIQRRNQLFQQLENQLELGKNIIVSPEGTSYPTEQSPGPFKSGMFRMALKMKKEPLIVPVVLANFDKRVRNNKFACQIQQPFKLSERMKVLGEKDVKSFLSKYQTEYKEDIRMLVKEASI